MRGRFYLSNLMLIVILAFCSSVEGDIIVSFGGPVNAVAGGGTSFIDVFVSSRPGTHILDVFSGEFLLKPVGTSPVGGLQFGTQLEAQLSQANYIHNGNSAGSPVGNVSGGNNETYIGGDSTANFLGTLVPEDPLNRLLFRLDLTTTTAQAGHQYTISLVDLGNTFFLNENFDPLSIGTASFTNTGTINITSAAVPEPGSVFLLSSILAVCLWRTQRKKNGSTRQ